jgi:hypothetical protein
LFIITFPNIGKLYFGFAMELAAKEKIFDIIDTYLRDFKTRQAYSK